MPSGRYLMEDFCYAGGLPVVMRELGHLLHTGHVGVTGRTLAENVAGAQCWNREVIRSMDEPFQPPGTGTAVLRGNLCPDGAVIKQSAASRAPAQAPRPGSGVRLPRGLPPRSAAA